ncbi:MAG: hypothetical protein LBB47_02575, partial [Spirochaetaceae bacterium]|nr:hypothetical protein [Spirochaetaceae bacterium]
MSLHEAKRKVRELNELTRIIGDLRTIAYFKLPLAGLKREAVRHIIKTMFKERLCAAGCGNSAISGSELCGPHCADPPGEARR